MRCPKCSYITYDNGERCRNCGYEFSLAIDPGALDLPIQTGNEPEGPLSDFSLEQLDEPLGAGEPRAAAPATAPPEPEPARPITSSFDLPLFGTPHDDRPLVSVPAVPRTPLSVRKTAPVVQRHHGKRSADEAPRLDLALPEEVEPERVRSAPRVAAAKPSVAAEVDPGAAHAAAPAGARILAAAIDLVLLGGIDLAVLHFTLKLCGLTYADIAVIPPAPFLAFLVLLNGGYAAAFTAAGGQSIGKMTTGIRVVPSDADAWNDRVPVGQSVLRAAGYFLSALPAGLGFVPGLFGEKRALHDRLARTRVVKT